MASAGIELVDTVPGQTVSGKRLAQRRTRPGHRPAAIGLARPGRSLFGALDDGGRRDRYDGEDLRALRIELGERTDQDIEGGGHVLHRARARAPPRRVGGVGQHARRHDCLLRQRLDAAGLTSQLHFPPNEMQAAQGRAR
ncbi:hypothetical protein [Streptomyces solincola]|uniref:hypothetical protein n=1 Tax=Streptomyces solincola TaxID=2100817 RepID=UPI0011B27E1C|nr:hypothetical protein [Streptomyces solincola]